MADPEKHPSISTAAAGSEPELVEAHQEETPTASHALAEEGARPDPEEMGHSQVEHGEPEVRNLGWNDDHVPQPVVGGLNNEELWAMTRRFNKQVFHVKSIDEAPLANLDLNIADDEEFTPEKFRAQLERLYMVVLVGLFSAWKHAVRLRSWREGKRTGVFLAAYIVAWLLDLLLPTIFGFLIVLVLHPPARSYCFPPAPPALIDANTGGVQKPAAGVLASDDSMTGAPEKHQGEAVEQEAHSFVTSISTVCSGLVISTAAGKHPQGNNHSDNVAPDPTELTAEVTDARDATDGDETVAEKDHTREPVSHHVWNQARPIMHAMADFIDTWERFGNMLNPTAPFPRRQPRLTLASCLLALLLGSWVTSPYAVMKSIGFSVGFGFFGDPVITPTLQHLNTNYPNWTKYLQLRHTILRGIPTNVQLVITLLRIGERNKAPLPPPPATNGQPAFKPHETAGEGLEHLGKQRSSRPNIEFGLTPPEGATDEEIEEAVQPDPDQMEPKGDPSGSAFKGKKPKKAQRILNLLKGTTKGGVQTFITADKAKAAAGGRHAKNRLGVVKGKSPWPERGPVVFPARCKGKKGYAMITTTATTPAVSWTPNLDDIKPVWTTTIGDIAELRKVGGLGWKSKIIVGWSLGREIVDGLMIRTNQGDELQLTAIPMRDDLFNRLIAMGNQMWESW